jgi:hypothetical protein
VFSAFQPLKPASRDPTGLVAPFLCKTETPLFDLSQRQSPLPADCME